MKYVPILLIVMSLLGYSQDFDKPCCEEFQKKHGMAEKMQLEMLDLTSEQREAIENAHREAEKKVIPLKADIELKRIDLESMLRADEPNRNKIMGLMKEISDLELKIKQTKVDVRLKVHSILTPEQREEMKGMKHKGMKKKIIIKKLQEGECEIDKED